MLRPTSSRRSSLPTEISTAKDVGYTVLRFESRKHMNEDVEERLSSRMAAADSSHGAYPESPSSSEPARQLPAVGTYSPGSGASLPALGQHPLPTTAVSSLHATPASKSSSADAEPTGNSSNSPLVPRRPDSARMQARPRPDAARSRSAEGSAIRVYRSDHGNPEEDENTMRPPNSPLSAMRPFSGRRNRTISSPESAPQQRQPPAEESALEHVAVASPGRIRASKVPHSLFAESSPIVTHAPASFADRPDGKSELVFHLDEVPNTRRLGDTEEELVKHPGSPLLALRPASIRPASPRPPSPRRGAASTSRSPVEKTGLWDDQANQQQRDTAGEQPLQHSRAPILERRSSSGSLRVRRRGGDSPLGALRAAVDVSDLEAEHESPPLNISGSSDFADGDGMVSRQAGTPNYVRPSTSRLLSTGVGRRSSLPEPLSAPRVADDAEAAQPDAHDDRLDRWLSPDSPSVSPMPMPPSPDIMPPSPSSPPPSPMPGASTRRRRLASAKIEERAASTMHEHTASSDLPDLPGSAGRGVDTDSGPPPSPLRSLRAEARESFMRGSSGLAVDVSHDSDGRSVAASPAEEAAPEQSRSGSPSLSSSPSHGHGILAAADSPAAEFLARTMASHKVLSQRPAREHEPSHGVSVSPAPPTPDRSQELVIDFKSLTLNSPPDAAAAQTGSDQQTL